MRYHIIDGIRGITLISMMIYHMVWDIVYIWGADWKWYQSDGAYIWQQSICWTFILLSGFCWNMGKNKLKRGLITFTTGIIITLITCIFMPDQRIVFGILTLIGSCTLILIVWERILKKIPIMLGMCSSLLLFMLFKSINK